MSSFLRMSDMDLAGKRVLIREDLNVPMKQGEIQNDARLRASLPTIELALKKGALPIVCSHLGRPKAGEFNPELSLQPIAEYLQRALGVPVVLASSLEEVAPAANQVVLLENVRFHKGEKTNDPELCQAYAELCDVFVMDAFGTAHRAEGSTAGVIPFAKAAAAGPLLASELDALAAALETPAKPLAAIVGGSKVSTKLEVLNALAGKCDTIFVGGGIANTFIAAAGYNVGKSLVEEDLIPTAQQIAQAVDVPLPIDVVVVDASQIHGDFMEAIANLPATIKAVAEVGDTDMILDIGPKTAELFAEKLKTANTILWNGPVGVFEVDAFSKGTESLGRCIFESSAFSLAGGGDTIAAIDKFDLSSGVSYISTGGGAFLEFVEGKTLPAVAALEAKLQA